MTKRKKRLLNSLAECAVCLMFFLAGLPSARAQSGTALTLETALETALSRNNRLRAEQYAVRKAVWDRRRAWSFLMPTLSLNTQFIRIDDRTFAERDFSRYFPSELGVPQTQFQKSYFTSLDVSVPLFNGALFNGLRIAGAQQEMTQQRRAATRDRLIFEVITGYLNVLKSREVLALQREFLELSRLNLEKAERLYRANRYARTDVLRWKVEYQQQKSEVVTGESALRNAKAVLARLLNLPPGDTLSVEDRIPPSLLGESERLAQLSDTQILALIPSDDRDLIRVNLELTAAKSSEEISRLLYRNTYAAYLPNITLDYAHAWRENNTLALDEYTSKTVMIQFSLPLFTGFQNLSAVKSSYYQYRQTAEQIADQLQNTRLVLTETANRMINLKTQRELARATVEFNDHNYRVVSRQREQGLLSNIDFIDAKLNLQNARLNDVVTQYDLIAAMVELYNLLGKLDALIP